MWRPKDWKYIKHEKIGILPHSVNPVINQAIGWDEGFEAGADAMLEAIEEWASKNGKEFLTSMTEFLKER